MAKHLADLGTLSLAAAVTPKSAIVGSQALGEATGLMFYAPVAFTGAVSVYVGYEPDTADGDMLPLTKDSTAVVIEGGKATYIEVSGFKAVQLRSAGTEAAIRSVRCIAVIEPL